MASSGRLIKVTSRHLAFGAKVAHFLQPVVGDFAETAGATCSFTLHGWKQGGHEGSSLRDYGSKPFRGQGRWVRTTMQNYGYKPSNLWRCSEGDNTRMVRADSFAAADEILMCFNLTMMDVIEHYGDVAADERFVWDLMGIVKDMCPDALR